MFTKEQLAKWEREGFFFDDAVKGYAVDEKPEALRIIEFKLHELNIPKKLFTIKVQLNRKLEQEVLNILLGNKSYQIYQKTFTETFYSTNYYADIEVVDLTSFAPKIYAVTANISNIFNGSKILSSTINIKIDITGKAVETNEEVTEFEDKEDNVPIILSLTKDQLISIGVTKTKAEEYVDSLNGTFIDYNINSPLKVAHFLAQVIHESGGFRFTKEYGVAESAYGGFIGRGLIQITTKGNYEAYEDYESEDFTSTLNDKKKLEKLPYSARSAGWFWDVLSNLNKQANNNDFIYITRIINGGFNGYNDRLKYLIKTFKVLNVPNNLDFKFKESRAYDDKRASFAWGLWHDRGCNKNGCTKDDEKALEGYKRFLEIVPENFTDTNWYQIKSISVFSDLKYSKNKKSFIKVVEAAKSRIKKLEEK